MPRPPASLLRAPVLAGAAGLVAAAATLLGYRTQPAVPLAALLGLVAVGVAVARPLAVVYLAIALIPLELSPLRLGAVGLSATEALFALGGLAWALRRLADGRLPVVPSPLNGGVAVLLLSVAAGFAVATDTFPVVRTLVMWTVFALVLWLILDDGRVETVRRLLGVLAAAGAVVAVISAVRSGGQPAQLSALGTVARGRAVGSLGDPNILGSFLALALPAALALGLAGPAARRVPALAAFALILLGLALSLSRGGFVAAAGGLLTMTAWRPFRRVALLAVLLVAALAGIGANPASRVQEVKVVVARLASLQYASQDPFDQRAALYRVTPRIVADHPLFGVGANNYSLVAPRYGLVDPYTGFTFEHAHDITLTIGAELGLVGLLGLGWLGTGLARVLWRACARAPVDRGLALAVAAALVGLALQGLVDYTLRSNVIAALAAVLAACAVVLSGRAPARRTAAR